jgi:hypothetical protein
MATSKTHMDGVEWTTTLLNLIKSAPKVQHDVDGLNVQFTDAYSLMAWRSICRHLRAVAHGMTVMRLVADGKSNAHITEATGIPVLSVAAYKAWNTMYFRRYGLDELDELNNNITAHLKVIEKEA